MPQLQISLASQATQPNRSLKQLRDKNKRIWLFIGKEATKCMVKLQFRVIENSYKNGQRVYFHGEVGVAWKLMFCSGRLVFIVVVAGYLV